MRGTIGRAKMLHFPRVNVAVRITAPPWSGNNVRDVASNVWSFSGAERSYFSAGR
jgi:hypothetical protein